MSRRTAPAPSEIPRADPCCGPFVGAAGSCPPVLDGPLGASDAHELAAKLKVLSDPGRLRLLGLIKAQPKGEACVCNLTSALGLSQPTVTHHLQVLHRAGFLARERRGVWVWYRVVPQALKVVRRALA